LGCASAKLAAFAERTLSSTMSPTLPQELSEDILTLISDRNDAISCSLVCRAWVLPSQRVLFHEISIRTRQRWHDLINFLLATPHLHLVIAKIRMECQLVKQDNVHQAQHCFPNVTEVAFFGHSANFDLLCYLPNLSTLEIHPNDFHHSHTFSCAYSGNINVALRQAVFHGTNQTIRSVMHWLAQSDTASRRTLRQLSITVSNERTGSSALNNHMRALSSYIQMHPYMDSLELHLSASLGVFGFRCEYHDYPMLSAESD
jgi:hypothetical protein